MSPHVVDIIFASWCTLLILGGFGQMFTQGRLEEFLHLVFKCCVAAVFLAALALVWHIALAR